MGDQASFNRDARVKHSQKQNDRPGRRISPQRSCKQEHAKYQRPPKVESFQIDKVGEMGFQEMVVRETLVCAVPNYPKVLQQGVTVSADSVWAGIPQPRGPHRVLSLVRDVRHLESIASNSVIVVTHPRNNRNK